MIPAPSLQDLTGLETLTRRIRGTLVEISHKKEIPHLGGALSCIDILVTLYWAVASIDPKNYNDPLRDRVILSKGHAATALYTCLAYRGFFPLELLETLNDNGGRLPEHPGPHCVPGVELATGSLGHGLSVAIGMALAGRILRHHFKVFVVMSDGECNEGSVWEAAQLAPAKGLNSLCVVIDYNKWQATGRSNEVTALAPLRAKWEAFGWNAVEVDGHDLKGLIECLKPSPSSDERPKAIIAHTVKGRGVSFMEDDNNWHYRIPNEEELRRAKQELGLV